MGTSGKNPSIATYQIQQKKEHALCTYKPNCSRSTSWEGYDIPRSRPVHTEPAPQSVTPTLEAMQTFCAEQGGGARSASLRAVSGFLKRALEHRSGAKLLLSYTDGICGAVHPCSAQCGRSVRRGLRSRPSGCGSWPGSGQLCDLGTNHRASRSRLPLYQGG